MTENQRNSLKWAVTEANKQLLLAEIAYKQKPNNASHKQSVEDFKSIYEGLSGLLESLGSKS